MKNSQLNLLNKLETNELKEYLKNTNLKTVMVFGSILTEDFNEGSDVDIAVLGNEKVKLVDILNLELFLEDLLGRPIDVIDLNSSTLDIFIKIHILNSGKVIYTTDNNKSLEELIDKTEWYYNENKIFFYFRRRDLIE